MAEAPIAAVGHRVVHGGDHFRRSVVIGREAKLHARINHPNVCKVFETGTISIHPYIAMQLVDGKPVHQVAESMSVEQRALIMRDVAYAVHALHTESLVHRDIKPSNILVHRREDGSWNPYLMDFGIARDLHAPSLTMTGEIIGTPSYMAPEQLTYESVELDPRIDVYSLGATLYEVLSGSPPFAKGNFAALVASISSREPPAITSHGRYVPRDLQTITSKCMDKDADRRYTSAQELAEDLQRYMDGQPIRARPPSVPYRLSKWAGRNRKAVWVGSIALVICAALSGLLVRQWVVNAHTAADAQRLGKDIRDIDLIMWRARSVPLQDTADQQQVVRERLDRIEGQLGDLGPHSRGIGYHALGRGYLALGEVREAHEAFENAETLGYSDAQMDYSHALALAELYRQELAVVAGVSQEGLRDELIRQAHAHYRDPALQRLQATGDLELDSLEYAQALMAYLDERPDEALTAEQQGLRPVGARLVRGRARDGPDFDGGSRRGVRRGRARAIHEPPAGNL